MNTQDTTSTKHTIINLLLGTNREGVNGLIDWLVEDGFFEGPASGRMHGSYIGGLADHSLAVRTNLLDFATKIAFSAKANWGQMAITIESVNVDIATLLHDVCKVGAYVRTKADDGWTNNRDKDKGHAKLSIARVKNFIELTKLEEMMIRYHMGMYHTVEYDPKAGEYPLTSGESGDTKGLTKEQKRASQQKRYGKSLRNAWYHNPIVKWMYFADEKAAAEQKVGGE